MLEPALALFDCFAFLLVAAFKRIQFLLFPHLKDEDIKRTTEKIMNDERANFFKWDKRNLGSFIYTWNMLVVIFKS